MTPNQSEQHLENLPTDLDPRHPNIQALEESFGGSLKGSSATDVLNSIPGGVYPTDQFPLQELQELQLPTTKPHLPFDIVKKDKSPNKNKITEYQSNKQNSGYHVEIPKVAPLPISATNPSNSLHIDYPPHGIAQDSNNKPQIINFANILQSPKIEGVKSPTFHIGTQGIDLSKLPTFNQIFLKDEFSFAPQINDIKEPSLVSGLPVALSHHESLKIPILNELPKEHRYQYQDIGNGPFPLEVFETLDSKQYGDSIFGGKIISQSLEVQPAIGYSLQDTGLHRI